MNIAITCNRKNSCRNYLKAEYDSDHTVAAIHAALAGMGQKPVVVEADESALQYFSSCNGDHDLVFNIAEGIRGESRESQIPALLDMLGIHYTGPGVRATTICQNKHVTKTVLKANGIPTPPWVLFPEEAHRVCRLSCPVVLKPVHEGSSIGITGEDSVARSPREAVYKARKLRDRYSQSVLIEEYLSGPEITVGIFGNRALEVLPLLEIYTEMYPPECMNMATVDAKTIHESDSLSGPPRSLTGEQTTRITTLACRAYWAIGCRDFGRIDFRLDADGVPSVMEINPIPGINPKIEEVSYFTKMCRMAGMSYEDMIRRILDETMERLQFR
jgi:D-alanine-D-alanine ligase